MENSVKRMNAHCMRCVINRQMQRVDGLLSEEKKTEYMKEMLKLFVCAENEASAPVLVGRINKLYETYVGKVDDYSGIKKHYNKMLLKQEEKFRQKILQSDNSLKLALEYARIANYIDFGAMDSVDEQQLNDLFDRVNENAIKEAEYNAFLKDLESAASFVYITDNCGEIVLDKLAVEQIKSIFPNLSVKILVRGMEIINDATMEDAKMIGLDKIAPVVGNGTAYAGTYLTEISDSVLNMLECADVILAKGQGNFESMNGCGLNIYYSFLCKCEWFVKCFKMQQFEGVFINDSQLQF